MTSITMLDVLQGRLRGSGYFGGRHLVRLGQEVLADSK